MNKPDMIARLKEIVKPYVKNADALEHLDETTDFIKDLQINSANLVDVALDVEEAFDITIDNASMEKMLTVDAALEIISEKLAEK